MPHPPLTADRDVERDRPEPARPVPATRLVRPGRPGCPPFAHPSAHRLARHERARRRGLPDDRAAA